MLTTKKATKRSTADFSVKPRSHQGCTPTRSGRSRNGWVSGKNNPDKNTGRGVASSEWGEHFHKQGPGRHEWRGAQAEVLLKHHAGDNSKDGGRFQGSLEMPAGERCKVTGRKPSGKQTG